MSDKLKENAGGGSANRYNFFLTNHIYPTAKYIYPERSWYVPR